MLDFSYNRSHGLEEWKLAGRLAGPWADELRTVWRRIRHHVPRAHSVIDLKEVTSIDDAGNRLLAEMRRAGARLVTAGTKPVRRKMEYLGGGLR